jgi:oligosaccharide repeat unit polymerase
MFVNPIFIYFIVWAIVFLLHSLGLSNMLLPIKSETIYLVVSTGIGLWLGWSMARLYIDRGIIKKRYIDQSRYREIFTNNMVKAKFRLVLIFWFLSTLLELIYFKNFPLLSLLGVGPYVSYTDFGFGGIHGLFNALYFVLVLYFVGRSFYGRKKTDTFILILLLFFPFLVMHRMMMIAVFVQASLLLYILLHEKMTIKFYVYGLLSFLVILLVFGYIGDFRSGREHILAAAGFSGHYPDWLPSAFAWLYVYVTTPLNNLNFNIENFINPNSFPIQTLSSFLPSFMRSSIVNNVPESREFELVVETFNAKTVFLPFLYDFGYILTPFIFIIIGFILFFFVLKSYRNPRFILFWVVFLYSLIVSVFANQMISLVFMFEAIFGFLLLKKRSLRGSRKISTTALH